MFSYKIIYLNFALLAIIFIQNVAGAWFSVPTGSPIGAAGFGYSNGNTRDVAGEGLRPKESLGGYIEKLPVMGDLFGDLTINGGLPGR